MEIDENHIKLNENRSKLRVASAGIAKPSNKKRKVVLFSSMYSFKWRKLLGMFAKTSMRNLWKPLGEAR